MEKSETLKLVELFLTPEQLEVIALFSLMESEIKDLKIKIADLEESLNAKSIDGAKPNLFENKN